MTPAESQQRLQQLALRLEPSLRAAFLRLAVVLRPAQVTELVRLLTAGDIEGAVDWLFTRPEVAAAIVGLQSDYATGLIQTTQATTRDLARQLRLVVEAPVLSPALIEAVRRWEDTAFARVRADLRAGLRETISTELARGIGPRQVAVALKSDVSAAGLTAYDARIVASYREALETSRVRDALQRTLRDRRYDRSLSGRPLSPAEIEKMVAAYRRKLVAFRAETFARTASIQAANDAIGISWRAGVDQGAYLASEVKRYWIVAEDERLCKICQPIPALNTAGASLDGAFATPIGPLRSPTAHPNCRCTVWIRLERAGIRQRPQPGTDRLILPKLPPR